MNSKQLNDDVKWTDHGINDVFELNHNHALHGHRNLLRQITSGDSIANPSNVLNLSFEQPELLDGAHATFKSGGSEWAGGDNQWRSRRRSGEGR